MIDHTYFRGDLPFPAQALEAPTILPMPEDEYHRVRAFSSSYLRSQVDTTPHHALTPVSQTDAMKVGVGFECLMEDAVDLASDAIEYFWAKFDGQRMLSLNGVFARRCAIKPVDLNRGEGARARAEEWKEQNEGKCHLTQVQALVCLTMLKSAITNKGWQAHLLKTKGEWQVAIFWVENDLPMKALLDVVCETHGNRYYGVDIKTVNGSISRGHSHDFAAKAANLRYDVQAAHYMTALAQVYGRRHVLPFVWLVVEQSRPYGTACYRASADMCSSGFLQREEAIRRLRTYIDKHERLPEFPVYSDEDEALEPPSWHLKRAANLHTEKEDDDGSV